MDEGLFIKFLEDVRFSVNELAAELLFKNNEVLSYSVDYIAIGNIRRYINKKIYAINETVVYKLCCNPSDEKLKRAYELYCQDPNNVKDNPNRSLGLLLTMLKKMDDEDYNFEKGAIIIDQYNCIVDGFHRSCILLKKYGSDYVIPVVRVKLIVGNRIKIIKPLFEIRYSLLKFFRRLIKARR